MVAPNVISNFEVLFTPQLPPGFPPAVENVVETVVKGYFLTLTNLNDAVYTYQIGFHCNTNPSPPAATRTLASAVAFIDDAQTGVMELVSGGAGATDFYASVQIQPNGTVLLGILPAFFSQSTGKFVTPNIEIRGYVDITLPALSSGFLRYTAQSSAPVSVIVTAEERLTFLPGTGEPVSVVESQSAFALPLATGASQFSIEPQPSYSVILHPVPVLPVAAGM